MDAPSVANSSPTAAEEEVVLRLGDLLARLPEPLLKPGPHDRTRIIRLSVDELAEQISHGRVSIPLQRVAAACPDIFASPESVPADEQVPLPLQKLLDRIGLTTDRSAPNSMPQEQEDEARATARDILKEAGVEDSKPTGTGGSGKPFSVVGKLLGLFGGRKNEKEATPAAETAASGKPAVTPKPTAKAKEKAKPSAPPEPVPDGFISLRVLPIFRLLGSDVLQADALPAPEARVVLPMTLIDPHLESGHVEVPLEELSKALPEDLRGSLRQVSGAQVWIPLDEIFQNLPPTHLYHMPPIDPVAEEEPEAEAAAPAGESAAKEMAAEAEQSPKPDAVAPGEESKEEIAQEKPANEEAVADKAEPAPAESAPSPAEEMKPEAPEVSAEAGARPESPTPPTGEKSSTNGESEPETPVQAEATAEAKSEAPSAAARTPEAKQTADFMASQPGIFAAAAFVEGAIFASSDFPRKPDLDTLRDVIGAFVEGARENARRLGWQRVLTLACENFHVTAAVRDHHFIAVLHHDRVLLPVSLQALVNAAEDLSRGGKS